MQIYPNPVTGAEADSGDGPFDALIGFYRAFNRRDLDALATNWAAGDAPSMDNPIGGIRRGWEEIAEGYRRLFGGEAQVYVEFLDFSAQGGDDFRLFVGRERGWCETPSGRIDLRIRTSRLFIRVEDAWRQLHHHGSMDEPSLLAAYQTAILGAILAARR